MVNRLIRASRWLGVGLAAFGVAASLSAMATHEADACGGFFSARTSPTSVPSLQVEQVVILHDAQTEIEHFVRRISFRDANEPFGFVVPVPSLPKVSKVEIEPFAELQKSFPMSGWAPPDQGGGPPGGEGSKGRGDGFGSGGVQVLSVEKVGSFTAFVLEASDATAIKKWLDENKLATTPASEAWLAHYVELHYLFVAFRFEPPVGSQPPADGLTGPKPMGSVGSAASSAARVKSETVRITFSTPLPYYPYLEPDHTDGPATAERSLAVWLISQTPSRPISAVKEGDHYAWKRPWKEGTTNAPIPADIVKSSVGASLRMFLSGPAETYVVQRFEDQKKERQGWGDVVLVPSTHVKLDAGAIDKRRKLMSALDPSLAGAK